MFRGSPRFQERTRRSLGIFPGDKSLWGLVCWVIKDPPRGQG